MPYAIMEPKWPLCEKVISKMYMVIWYVIHDVQEASAKIVNLRPLGQAPGGFCNAWHGHIVKILIILKKKNH